MTDKELNELANKVSMAIKLENPKARYVCFFYAGQSSSDTLQSSVAIHSTTVDWIAAIDSLLDALEEEGLKRDAVLMGMLKQGPIGGKVERW